MSTLKTVGCEAPPPSRQLSHPILAELETIASATAEKNGFNLCGLHLHTNLIPMTMQVQIRHSDGGDVSLDDCARFSEPMGDAIEASELLDQGYVLEISSPGIGEQLKTDKDFKTFKGFPIEVTIQNDSGSNLSRTGLLHERSETHVHLNIKGQIKQIPREEVISVRLTTSKS